MRSILRLLGLVLGTGLLLGLSIAPATDADGFAHFRVWLDRGFAGEMDYLHTQGEQRRHPRSILETVRSVLMVGMEYGATWPSPPNPLSPGRGGEKTEDKSRKTASFSNRRAMAC